MKKSNEQENKDIKEIKKVKKLLYEFFTLNNISWFAGVNAMINIILELTQDEVLLEKLENLFFDDNNKD